MANLSENLTAQMQELVEKSVTLAIHAKNPQTFPLHLLWALVTDSGSLLNQVFNKMNIGKDAMELEVKKITRVRREPAPPPTARVQGREAPLTGRRRAPNILFSLL